MFLHAHGVIQRVDQDTEREKVITILKGVLERQIRLLETEAYGLADELESEDPSFAHEAVSL